MSTKVKKCKEPARVTFPAPEEEEGEEEGEDVGAEPQRRPRGWRGVNGGLEPRAASWSREPHGHRPPPWSPGPDL